MSAINVCQYIPHGAIPDQRGFAPAIVAQNLVENCNNINNFFISDKENYAKLYEHTKYGDVYRIYHTNLYKKFFQKILKIDINPLYKKAGQIINNTQCDIFCPHQIEFEVDNFKKNVNKNIKIIVYGHSLRTFDKNRGVADKYIAVSEYTKNMMIEKFNYPKDLIEVIYNGVNTSLFGNYNNIDIKNWKKAYNIPDNGIVISYIGRKQEAKGYYISLQVMKYILDKYDNIFCFCVGPRPKDYIKDTHLAEIIELEQKLYKMKNFIELSAQTHDELRKIFNITDITLFPTFSNAEQHPLVSVEAMASKTILITSKHASLPEVVKNNQNGFLIDNPQKPDEIINFLDTIIPNIKKYDYIKENARKTAVEKFDWKISAKKFESICKNLKG